MICLQLSVKTNVQLGCLRLRNINPRPINANANLQFKSTDTFKWPLTYLFIGVFVGTPSHMWSQHRSQSLICLSGRRSRSITDHFNFNLNFLMCWILLSFPKMATLDGYNSYRIAYEVCCISMSCGKWTNEWRKLIVLVFFPFVFIAF